MVIPWSDSDDSLYFQSLIFSSVVCCISVMYWLTSLKVTLFFCYRSNWPLPPLLFTRQSQLSLSLAVWRLFTLDPVERLSDAFQSLNGVPQREREREFDVWRWVTVCTLTQNANGSLFLIRLQVTLSCRVI